MDGKFTHNLTDSKLSKLQRWMVARAYRNRIAEKRGGTGQGADLFYKEVLASFYDFEYEHFNPEYDDLRRSFGHKRFDPEVIGRSRYNAASAAISRAVARLAKRGLVTQVCGAVSHWAGIELTELGVVLAERVARVQ
jgi:hypothetical protein